VNVARKLTRGHQPAWTAVEVKSLNGGVRFEIAVQVPLP
jgi:enamine deaminase RidA (YjgF/YER057c/UK114 family)